MVQLASLSSTAPITALHLLSSPPSSPKCPALLASGRASELVVSSLKQTSSLGNSVQDQTRSWKVLKRERVHRIISRPLAEGAGWQLLLSGGKEAALVVLSCNGTHGLPLDLRIIHRFVLNDWVHDVAFLESSYLFLTSHNTLLRYNTPDLPFSSSKTSPPAPQLVKTIHCPLRPLLWCGAFSKSSYSGDDVARGDLKLGGGSMLGDVLSWAVSGEQLEGDGERTLGAECVQKLQGHHGAIFSVSFSPSARYLVSGSDDRTVRVWNLQASAQKGGEPLRLTMWGHEGRVWRVRWLAEDARSGAARVVTVAEDSSCNIWSLALPTNTSIATSSTSPTELTYTLLKSYQNGHDGKSMWSVTSGSFPLAESGGEQTVIFTGGADGGVRSWLVPSSSEPSEGRGEGNDGESGFAAFLEPLGVIKAFTIKVDPRTGKQEALLINAEGALHHASITPSSLPSSPRLLFSSSFLRNPSLLHLHFPSSPTDGSNASAEAWIFTNRGQAIVVKFSLSEGKPGSVEVQEKEIGVAAVSLRVEEGERRVALTERKDGGRVVLVQMSGKEGIELGPSFAFEGPAFATPRERLVTATNFFPSPPSIASRSLFLLGTSLGSLILVTLPTSSPDSPLSLATARKVLVDGVTDLALLSEWYEGDQGWSCEVESVGRDGVRAVVRVNCSAEGQEWSMKVVGQQKVSKGILDQILPPLPSTLPSLKAAGQRRRYLALQDANAIVFDERGTKLLSFLSPGNSVPRAVVEDTNGTHYYRIVQGKIHHQLAPLSSTSLAPSILPSLHGREIRCVALHRAQVAGREVTLVATGAENAVLKISLLDPTSYALIPLFTDSSIPSALKSICWSLSASALYLFASGAGEMLLVLRVEVSSARESEMGVRVNVQPWVQAEAITSPEEEKEKGQVRVMDMGVRSFPVSDDQDERHLVLTGWSDGKLRVHLFDPLGRSLLLTAESKDYGKCLLTVQLFDFHGRWLAVSGASDGLLAITDITPLVNFFTSMPASVAPLPSVLLSYHPHQSGINGLDVSYSDADRALTIATAGDDNAVCVRRALSSSSSTHDDLEWEGNWATLPRAHGSTIQGLHFLSSTLLCSTAVDQRLNVYRLDLDQGGAPKLAFAAATCLGVADCSAMDVIADAAERATLEDSNGEGYRSWTIVSVGIGAEVTRVEL